MRRQILAFVLISATAASVAAQSATPLPPPPPVPKVPGDIVPLGTTGNANYSTAWFVDTVKNQIVVCRSDDSMGGNRPPRCSATSLP